MPLAREGGRAVQATCEVRSQCARVGEVAQRGDRLQRPMKEEQDYDNIANRDCKERDLTVLNQLIMTITNKSICAGAYADQLCVTRFVLQCMT